MLLNYYFVLPLFTFTTNNIKGKLTVIAQLNKVVK